MLTERCIYEQPVLFMANHLFPAKLWPAFVSISREHPNTRFVCDAAFAPFLKASGLDVIKIDNRNKEKHLSDRSDKLRARITILLGRALKQYETALNGEKLTDAMAATINSGKNLFIIPACTSSPKAIWKKAIGFVIPQIDKENTLAGFVYLDRKSIFKRQVTISGTFGVLVPSDMDRKPHEIAKLLQEKYKEIYGVGN